MNVFGPSLHILDEDLLSIFNTVYCYDTFCKSRCATANVAAFSIWNSRHGMRQDIREFYTLYRGIRYRFNKLESAGIILKSSEGKGFRLNHEFANNSLI